MANHIKILLSTIIYPPVIFLLILCILSGCIKSFEENPSATPRPASCDECHSFPGSNYCRTDAAMISGKPVTSCVLCHMGAVKLDSTVTTIPIDTVDTAIVTVYHDLMIAYNNNYYTAVDSLHTNDTVNVNFGQCTKCHGYPPIIDGHEYHVIEKKKRCFDCHLFSFQCSTYVEAGKTIYKPKKQKGLGTDSVYIPDPQKHLNGISGDITFKQKIENASLPGYDTAFIWNEKEKSCSNVKCHPPTFPKKLVWQEGKSR